MTTFVLVHGAWGGPHTFRNVRRRLWAAGHEVFTPGLTGLGERAHLISPLVDLRTHTSDLVNHLEFENLRGVVLVGYSYGGMVVTDALRRIAGVVPTQETYEVLSKDAPHPDAALCFLAWFGSTDGGLAALEKVEHRPTGAEPEGLPVGAQLVFASTGEDLDLLTDVAQSMVELQPAS